MFDTSAVGAIVIGVTMDGLSSAVTAAGALVAIGVTTYVTATAV